MSVKTEVIPQQFRNLGRHIQHDERSRAYKVPIGEYPSRDVHHHRYGAKLDQGQLGACTGFAGAHCLNTAPNRAQVRPRHTLTDADAVKIYSAATKLDTIDGEYPPDDTGSTGLAVCKAMKEAGLINSYAWAFGFKEGLYGISAAPFMQGTYWTEDMFNPSPEGIVTPTGPDVGGHEYLWVGVELRSKKVPSQNLSWFFNSWGDSWSKRGYFAMTWENHDKLLARDGDLIRPIA